MDSFYFVQVVGAVVVGNLFSAMGVYFAYRVSRHEKHGGDPADLPFWMFLVGLAPFAVVGAAALLMP
jgi:hypothetical protein